jgi:hypothetical protein
MECGLFNRSYWTDWTSHAKRKEPRHRFISLTKLTQLPSWAITLVTLATSEAEIRRITR